MSLTIETLLVKLQADIADYKKNLGEAAKVAKQQSTEINASLGSLTAKANAVSTAMKALIPIAAVAGVAHLTKEAINSADELGKLRDVTGQSTDLLQSLGYAASQTNVEQGELNQSLTVFNRTIGDAAVGNEQAQKAFRQLGISITDSSGHLKSNETLLRQAADAISRMGSSAEQASAAQDLFGRAGGKLLPLLKDGSAGFDAFAQKAQELGLILDAKLIEQADETNDKLATMHRVVGMQLNRALLELTPLISTAADAITKLATKVGPAAQEISMMWKALSGGAKTNNDQIAILNDQIAFSRERIKGLKEEAKDPGILRRMFGPDVQTEIAGAEKWLKTLEAQLKLTTDAEAKAAEAAKKTAGAHKVVSLNIAERNRLQKEAQDLLDKDAKGGDDKGKKLQYEIDLFKKTQDQKISLHGDATAAIESREQDLKAFGEEKAVKEIEDLMAKNEQLRSIDESHFADKIASNQSTIDFIQSHANLSEEAKAKIAEKSLEQEKKRNKERLADFNSTMSFISTLQHSKSKTMAAVGKAAAISQAAVQTFLAANLAYSVGLQAGFPVGIVLGPALAAAAVAAGMSNVANIAGVDIGFAKGVDQVPGIGRGDSVRAMLEPMERVVPRDTNEILQRFLLGWEKMQAVPMTQNSGGVWVHEFQFGRGFDSFIELVESRLIERARISTGLGAVA